MSHKLDGAIENMFHMFALEIEARRHSLWHLNRSWSIILGLDENHEYLLTSFTCGRLRKIMLIFVFSDIPSNSADYSPLFILFKSFSCKTWRNAPLRDRFRLKNVSADFWSAGTQHELLSWQNHFTSLLNQSCPRISKQVPIYYRLDWFLIVSKSFGTALRHCIIYQKTFESRGSTWNLQVDLKFGVEQSHTISFGNNSVFVWGHQLLVSVIRKEQHSCRGQRALHCPGCNIDSCLDQIQHF